MTELKHRFGVFLTTTFIFLAPLKAEAWKTLITPRFKILIASDFVKQGEHIATQAERALTQLQNVYSEIPHQPILIVVDHRTNASNGSATHFPYPHIVIYPALPSTYSSIGEYHEWVFELILHELVHYLTFYPTHGVYKPVQWVFGNLFAPNFILLPSWFHEGLAVSLETHLTSGGRMRSEGYKEMYKILSQDLKLGHENLSTINERYLPSFPYGQRPYFFGSLVLNESTRHKSPKELNQTIQGFSRAIPPYNIYSSAKKNLGQSFKKSRKSLPVVAIDKNLATEYKKIFIYPGHSPIWLDAENFLTLSFTKDLNQQLLKNTIAKGSSKTKKPQVLTTLIGTERIYLSSDKTLLLFDQLSPYQRMDNTTDLYTFNLITKKTTRHTYGDRLREGALAKNKSKAIAVQTDLSTTQLVEVDLTNTKAIKVLYAPKTFETRISSPSYVADDQKILFIEKPMAQKSQLKVLDLKTMSLQNISLAKNFEKIFWIEFQNGKLLLHAKESNKPRQHYILDAKFQAQQITFDAIGTRSAALKNNQLLVSHLSDQDYVTALYTDFKQQAQNEPIDFKIELSKNLILTNTPTQPVAMEDRGYSFLNYMVPKYWFPFISPNYGGFGNQFLYSASTGATDPLGINSYSATLRQDTISDRLSGGINYFHANKNLIWGLSANQFESPLTEEISRTFKTFGISTRYDFGHDRNLGSSLTLSLSHTDANADDILRVNPTAVDINIKSVGPQLTYNYNSLMQEPSRVAPSHGQFVSLSLAHYLEQKNYFAYNFLEGYYETYFSKYLVPNRTSLKLFGKALASSEPLPAVFRPVNLSGYFTTSRQQNSFVIRGYPSGIFQASEAAYNIGLEYYFPLLNIFYGPESLPIFFRRIFGALVADAGSFKGRIFNGVDTFLDHDFNETYYGAGFEVHAELTIGHYIPLKLSLGIYQGLQELNGIEPNQVFINFTTPDLP